MAEITDVDGDGVPDLVAASGIKHTWALSLAMAVRNADGEVVYQERIPGTVVEEVLAEELAG